MVFRANDEVLIKSLYQLERYNARSLCGFTSKGWTKCSLNKLLKDAGSVT